MLNKTLFFYIVFSVVFCCGNEKSSMPTIQKEFDSISASNMGSINKFVVTARDVGFFSNFNEVMSNIVYEMEENPNSTVYPDWHISSINKIDLHFCYGNENDGNIWLKIFEPIRYDRVDKQIYQDLKLLYKDSMPHRLKSMHHPNPFSIDEYGLEKNLLYNHYYNKLIHPLPHIKDKINSFYSNHFVGNTVISVHSRVPYLQIIHPEAFEDNALTLDMYLQKIHQVISENNIDIKKMKIYLATDNEKSIEFFESKFPSKVIYQKGVLRITKDEQKKTEKKLDTLEKEQRYTLAMKSEAHSIAAHSQDKSKCSTANAEHVFIDVALMSKGDFYIGGPSNLAWATFYMNPYIKKYSVQE